MIFTTNRRFAKPHEPPLKYIESPAMTFSNKYRNHIMQKMQTTQQIQQSLQNTCQRPHNCNTRTRATTTTTPTINAKMLHNDLMMMMLLLVMMLLLQRHTIDKQRS